jgi:hypothetical protein
MSRTGSLRFIHTVKREQIAQHDELYASPDFVSEMKSRDDSPWISVLATAHAEQGRRRKFVL